MPGAILFRRSAKAEEEIFSAPQRLCAKFTSVFANVHSGLSTTVTLNSFQGPGRILILCEKSTGNERAGCRNKFGMTEGY